MGEYSDGAFVREIAERADCHILIDLHNLWANEQNGRQPVREFIAEIPLHRVCEVHLAGGIELDGYWLDAHSGAIPEPLLLLAEEILPQLPNLGALVFEIMPNYAPLFGLDRVAEQLEEMHRIWRQRLIKSFIPGTWCTSDCQSANATANTRVLHPSQAELDLARCDARLWENTLGALILGDDVSGKLAEEVSSDPAVNVYQRLIQEQRAGLIVEHLRLTTRLIVLHQGVPYLRSLLIRFWGMSPPQLFEIDDAEAFSEFILASPPDVPHLESVLRFEIAAHRKNTCREIVKISFSCDPLPLLTALAENRLPEQVALGYYELEIAPETIP
jgi:hypothetical protein